MTAAERDADRIWQELGEALDGQGWRWRVVAVERLAETAARVAAALDSVGLTPDSGDSDGELLRAARAELPPELPEARAVIVGAHARPLTRATLAVDGREHTVVVPPHYAAYDRTPREFAALTAATLAPHRFRAAEARVPLKTLAAGSGLAAYGRNNITYVAGLGSYLSLAACVTDLAAPPDATWADACPLEACTSCFACARVCPTRCIDGASFVIHADRCLTMLNESEEPFPDWVDPAWHACAVGCLRCQEVCPANTDVTLEVEDPVRFTASESAAILAADQGALRGSDVTARLAACGLDYDAALIARNVNALLAAATTAPSSDAIT